MKFTENHIAVLNDDQDGMLSRWVERDRSLDAYDPRIRTLFAPMIPLGGAVVDAGACIGDHTVAYAERASFVFAFEPFPPAFECLFHNTLDRREVLALPVGLGERKARWSMATYPHNAGATFLQAENGNGFPIVPLDSFGLTRLDFFKLDVEGFELKALRGAQSTLSRCKPIVLVETGEQLKRYGDEHGEMVDWMAGLGYKCESVPPERPDDTAVYDVLFVP